MCAILFLLILLTNNQRPFVQKSCLAIAIIFVLGWPITCALGGNQVLLYNQIGFTTSNVQPIIWMLIDGCFTHRRICHTSSHMLVWYSEKDHIRSIFGFLINIIQTKEIRIAHWPNDHEGSRIEKGHISAQFLFSKIFLASTILKNEDWRSRGRWINWKTKQCWGK